MDELEDEDVSLPPVPRKASSNLRWIVAALFAILVGLAAAIFFFL